LAQKLVRLCGKSCRGSVGIRHVKKVPLALKYEKNEAIFCDYSAVSERLPDQNMQSIDFLTVGTEACFDRFTEGNLKS
jgi:hypothetical protein